MKDRQPLVNEGLDRRSGLYRRAMRRVLALPGVLASWIEQKKSADISEGEVIGAIMALSSEWMFRVDILEKINFRRRFHKQPELIHLDPSNHNLWLVLCELERRSLIQCQSYPELSYDEAGVIEHLPGYASEVLYYAKKRSLEPWELKNFPYCIRKKEGLKIRV